MKLTSKDKNYFLSREKKATRIIKELESFGYPRQKEIKLLEVGCNHGFIAYHLAKKTLWDISAGDTNEKHLQKYTWIKKEVKLSYLDATDIKEKPNSYDIVLYNHVIEHIPAWKKTIPQIYNILRTNGVLYLATPNLHRKVGNLKLLFSNKKNLTNKKRIDNHFGFSAKELRKMLSQFSELTCINKEHTLSNVPTVLKPLAGLIPESLFEKYSQTNVFVARK